MWFWIGLLLITIVVCLLACGYLVSRFCRMDCFQKIDSKRTRIMLAILPVGVIVLGLTIVFNLVNAVIIIFHLTVIWFVAEVINIVVEKSREKKSNYYIVSTVAILFTAGYLAVGWYAAHHVDRTEYQIETKKTVEDLKIIQFADSHIGTTFSGKGLLKEVERMNEDQPDVVLITGDFVDDDTSKQDMIDACESLKELKTAYGTYFCYGNHDKGYYGSEHRGFSAEDLKYNLVKNGVKVLEDEVELVDDRFYIIGRKDMSDGKRDGELRKSINELTDGLDARKYMIVLDHQPYEYEEEKTANVDLVLSGHTHGGQLFPVNYFGVMFGLNAKRYGHEKKENTDFIVTSGISDWAILFKTGCISEYNVIEVTTEY
ncbi:MAG: metallophosphoesterase [Lachnospiraceae bacterium]|nr:metallophosphoesterase [Lachnospiraceae bacterium]